MKKNAKQLLLVAIFIVLQAYVANVCASCPNNAETCSHTFFRPQSLSQNSMLELALHNYDYYHRSWEADGHCCRDLFNIQATASFYFRSTNKKSLAKYFLPECKEQISIVRGNNGDISAPWLCLINQDTGQDFESTVKIRPRRDVIGGAFKLWFDFGALNDCAWYSNLWATVFFPVVNVRHDLNFEEDLVTPGNAPECPTNAAEAFNNPTWRFGRLSTKTLNKTGVDDMEFKLGYDFVRNDDNHASGYFVVFAPTGRKSRADFLFEPTFGSGGHVGLGGGFNGEYLFYECNNHKLSVITDFRYAYFLKGTETRSFDLRNGEWSRYLLVVQLQNVNQPVLPGINFFTQKVDVTPGSTIYWWTTLHYNHCDWDFESGYSFWWREREKICVKRFDPNIGIFDITGVCPDKTTANKAIISVSIPGTPSDLFPTMLTANNINSRSGQHPTALSSTVYVAASRLVHWCDTDSMIGLGVSYEIAHRRSALSQWGLWLKTGIGF